MSVRVGCDIGGTFTDVVLLDEVNGKLTLIKVPSTPKKPEIGAVEGIVKAIKEAAVNSNKLRFIFHATTIATNAIIGQIGIETSKVGLVTTKGFKDLLEIGRQIRPDPYDIFTDKPMPLIPRYLRMEVSERIGADGEIIKPLNVADVKRVIAAFKREGVTSIAVCTLFSFLNPAHENMIKELIEKEYPQAKVSLSHEILPEFREYERMSTAVINACLIEIVERYLSSFEEKLRKTGLRSKILLMQSNGKVMTTEMAKKRPIYIVESGPAAGVIASAYIGRILGYRNLVSFDMGGTTAKVCLIEGYEPKVTTEFEVGGKIASGRIVRGSGWPIKVPVIDLVEIGAGGGSIAWVDPDGVLKVGPKSAGADPGPACYGRGGEKPTVTDAYLYLGVINPEYFVGGEIPISVEYAEKSIKRYIADPLGLDPVEAASGIVEIANANMSRALRIVSVERGLDPQELVMIAFGGAGPMVAGRMMEELGFSKTIIPEAPGLFSAFGMLVSDVGYSYTLTRLTRTSNINYESLSKDFNELVKAGVDDLLSEGIPRDRIVIIKSVDMRYVGQSYELNIPFPEGNINEELIGELERRFHSAHEVRYGYCAPEDPIELVNLRVSTIGVLPKFKPRKFRIVGEDPSRAKKGYRDVYFRQIGDFVKCPVYDKYRLEAGNRIDGPAVIEQVDSTIVINPNQSAIIDPYLHVVIFRN